MANREEFERERKRLQAERQQLNQQLKSQLQAVDKIVAFCDRDIKQLTAGQEPNKDHYLLLCQLRRLTAMRGREILDTLLRSDPASPDRAKHIARVQALKIESQFLSTEYQIVNYRPVARAIEKCLASPMSGTGRLAERAGQQGTGRLSAARPQTGQLGQARAGNTGPLSQNRLGTGTGQLQSSAQPEQAQGPSQQRAAALSQLARDPAKRTVLEQMLGAFKELETEMGALRGAGFGEMAVPHKDAQVFLNKLAGKIYYLNRTIEQLGPEAQWVMFQHDAVDPNLEMYMATTTMAPASEGEGGKSGLSGMLRSFMGSLTGDTGNGTKR